ncbi:nuclear transport factor 2 family protein [Flavobacterium sp.]|uniref:nuclear transport factor 2 family protein n=1 Tax=Flavobacterium sp. TaxID=239 RepID=UPI0026180807|nr:nuclear transport factor 2 family protein [Flavobacterium sp.]
MENKEIITNFYTAFANGNAEEMTKYYHQNATFEDPAFGKLNQKEVISMWKMLIERSKGNLKIEFKKVSADGNSGSATWIATYLFSQTNRKVINIIDAEFKFKDGLIIQHKDNFDLYKWSKQALGWKGFLLGWTNFMRNKIQQNAKKSLQNYMLKNA